MVGVKGRNKMPTTCLHFYYLTLLKTTKWRFLETCIWILKSEITVYDIGLAVQYVDVGTAQFMQF